MSQAVKLIPDNLKDTECVFMEITSKSGLIDPNTKETITEYVLPKGSCKYCYGRGFVGKDAKDGTPIICRCIAKEFVKYNSTALLNKQKVELQYQYKNVTKKTPPIIAIPDKNTKFQLIKPFREKWNEK